MGSNFGDEDPLARTNSGRSSKVGISHGRAQAAFDNLLVFLRDQIDKRTNGIIEHAERTLSRSAALRADPKDSVIRNDLYQRLVKALTTAPEKKVVAFNEMRILSEESMRVTLARAKLVHTVTERAQEELIGLRVRLNALQQAGVFVIPQALSPDMLADGLLQTLNDLQVPPQIQTQIMEAYCAQGAEPLHQMYQGANQLLIEHGVMPDYLITNLKSSHSSRFHETTENRYELEQKFIQLQETLCGLSLDDWRPGLLRRLLDTPPRYTPAEAQQKTFDRVEAGFIAIAHDEKISGRIRAEIHRLALPVLTVHLTAPDQASTSDGPVQLFMRQLVSLGHRDKESPLRAFDSVKIVVSRVVSEFGREMDSFCVGSEGLFTLSKNEIKQRMAEGTPVSTKPACGTGIENAEAAKQYVTEELRYAINGLALPPAMMQVVLKLMAPWMMIRLQRYGKDSIAWTEAKTWAAAFFDLMRPASSEEEHSRLYAARRFALKQIQVRTERSSMSPPDLAALLKNLEQYFEQLDWTDKSGLNTSSSEKSQ